MGPQATVDFMARVVAATTANSDQDHIHMIVDHNPQVPNRHAAVAGKAPSIGPVLAAMARRLEDAGADFPVMVEKAVASYLYLVKVEYLVDLEVPVATEK